jgi:hypothetical protein
MIIRYYDTLVLLSTERTCCFTWAGAGREHHFSILVERTDLLFDIGSHCHFHVVDSFRLSTTPPTRTSYDPHQLGPLDYQSLRSATREPFLYLSQTSIHTSTSTAQPDIDFPPQPQSSSSPAATSLHNDPDRQDGRTTHHDRHPARRDLQRHHLRRRRAETLAITKRRRRQQVQPPGAQVPPFSATRHWQAGNAKIRV